MYKQIETDKSIEIKQYGNTVVPIATLSDEYGGRCQIILDDHCYVSLLRKEDGTYSPTNHIFRELFNVLITLPEPK